jgi:hypothetical protein
MKANIMVDRNYYGKVETYRYISSLLANQKLYLAGNKIQT